MMVADHSCLFAWTSLCSCRRDSACSHQAVLTEEDLQEFLERLKEKEGTERGGQAWCPLMEKRTGRMTYTAWRRDPQVRRSGAGQRASHGASVWLQ